MELNIISNPDKWAISESTDSLDDTDIDIDAIIDRNIGAWRELSKK